jgi:hypothetical protein
MFCLIAPVAVSTCTLMITEDRYYAIYLANNINSEHVRHSTTHPVLWRMRKTMSRVHLLEASYSIGKEECSSFQLFL